FRRTVRTTSLRWYCPCLPDLCFFTRTGRRPSGSRLSPSGCFCATGWAGVRVEKRATPNSSPSRAQTMQIIVCDCGTELPFSERDLSAAAGKLFTCPICGRTRKLPLANVFTPADRPVHPSLSDPQRHAKSGRFKIIAAIAVTALLFLAGLDDGVR